MEFDLESLTPKRSADSPTTSSTSSTSATRAMSTPINLFGASSPLPIRVFGSKPSTPARPEAFPILRLPDCVLHIVFGFLTYDQVAQLRVVCRTLDQICKRHLNKGFKSVERYHSKCQKEIKAKLPRRESVRRNHPFARHSDILSAIETRISLLSMTFMKYVEMNLCCFIPGKVIDEIFRVLRVIKQDQQPPRSHEILQELRDISSMAMEYFDEKIVPTFKLNINSSSTASALLGISPSKILSPSSYMSPGLPSFLDSPSASVSISSPSTSSSASSISSVSSFVKDVVTVQHRRVISFMKKNQKQLTTTQKALAGVKGAQNDQRAKITALEKCVSAQENLIKCQTEKLKQQEAVLSAQTEQMKQTETRLGEMAKAFADFERRLSEAGQQQQQQEEPAGTRKRKSSDTDEPEPGKKPRTSS